MLPFALYAYYIGVKMSTGATLYSFNIWNGSSITSRDGNSIVKNIDRFWARRGRTGKSEAWTTKPSQWKEDNCNLSPPTLPEENGESLQ